MTKNPPPSPRNSATRRLAGRRCAAPARFRGLPCAPCLALRCAYDSESPEASLILSRAAPSAALLRPRGALAARAGYRAGEATFAAGQARSISAGQSSAHASRLPAQWSCQRRPVLGARSPRPSSARSCRGSSGQPWGVPKPAMTHMLCDARGAIRDNRRSNPADIPPDTRPSRASCRGCAAAACARQVVRTAGAWRNIPWQNAVSRPP